MLLRAAIATQNSVARLAFEYPTSTGWLQDGAVTFCTLAVIARGPQKGPYRAAIAAIAVWPRWTRVPFLKCRYAFFHGIELFELILLSRFNCSELVLDLCDSLLGCSELALDLCDSLLGCSECGLSASGAFVYFPKNSLEGLLCLVEEDFLTTLRGRQQPRMVKNIGLDLHDGVPKGRELVDNVGSVGHQA